DRLALHSQLAAAVQVLLHVSRDRGGRRQLAEIAVLRRSSDGLVTALTAWHAERGFADGMADLSDLLVHRSRA
ncbi:MAG: pilus assembly protein CpaF, partial [Mycobacterium sp.]|nr:pilus assembly protein CpaF [Mycobacterium sp.]